MDEILEQEIFDDQRGDANNYFKEPTIYVSKYFINNAIDLTKIEIAVLISISSFIQSSYSNDEYFVTSPISSMTVMAKLKMDLDNNGRNKKKINNAIRSMNLKKIFDVEVYQKYKTGRHEEVYYIFKIKKPVQDDKKLGIYFTISNNVFDRLRKESGGVSTFCSMLSCYITINGLNIPIKEKQMKTMDIDSSMAYIRSRICTETVERIGGFYDSSARSTSRHLQILCEGGYIVGYRTTYSSNFGNVANKSYFATLDNQSYLKDYIEYLKFEDYIYSYKKISKRQKIEI